MNHHEPRWTRWAAPWRTPWKREWIGGSTGAPVNRRIAKVDGVCWGVRGHPGRTCCPTTASNDNTSRALIESRASGVGFRPRFHSDSAYYFLFFRAALDFGETPAAAASPTPPPARGPRQTRWNAIKSKQSPAKKKNKTNNRKQTNSETIPQSYSSWKKKICFF